MEDSSRMDTITQTEEIQKTFDGETTTNNLPITS